MFTRHPHRHRQRQQSPHRVDSSAALPPSLPSFSSVLLSIPSRPPLLSFPLSSAPYFSCIGPQQQRPLTSSVDSPCSLHLSPPYASFSSVFLSIPRRPPLLPCPLSSAPLFLLHRLPAASTHLISIDNPASLPPSFFSSPSPPILSLLSVFLFSSFLHENTQSIFRSPCLPFLLPSSLFPPSDLSLLPTRLPS